MTDGEVSILDMGPKVEFRRNDFFEMVWSEPMIKLAAKLQISDVAVKKICVKHEIPVPGLGYWAKIAAGHRLERPKLPPPSKPQLDEIRIYGSPKKPNHRRLIRLNRLPRRETATPIAKL